MKQTTPGGSQKWYYHDRSAITQPLERLQADKRQTTQERELHRKGGELDFKKKESTRGSQPQPTSQKKSESAYETASRHKERITQEKQSEGGEKRKQ